MSTKQIDYQRQRECMTCGHSWTSRVELSDYTQKLSGESKQWCPECSSAGVISYEATRILAPGDEANE
jgi:hypothetical protein